ncbi:unnamed protein product [Closterium sp. Naga37s-1]|nr:unnamed protein product [Closterium sp. Naga37s-1]
MPPMQCDGQLYRNTLYTLQHEARALGNGNVRRLWVMNNVLNDMEQQRIVDAILSHGYSEEVQQHSRAAAQPSSSVAAKPSSRVAAKPSSSAAEKLRVVCGGWE